MERRNGVLLATPHGSLNTPSAARFQTCMQEAILESDRAAVIDLSQSPYVSSSGLRALLTVAREFQGPNSGLAVCALPTVTSDVFRITGFNKIIPVYESRDDALAAFGE